MSKKFSPHPDTVCRKVIDFFRGNPEETLDREAISIKFGCLQNAVHTLLGPAVQAGVLLRKENLGDGELIYSVGDLKKFSPLVREKFQLDESVIKIEKNVPVPPRAKNSAARLAAQFGRMAVGDSFELPEAGRFMLSTAITAYKKANRGVNLVTRVTDGKVRVWRIA